MADAFSMAWSVAKGPKYPPGDPRWDEPDPREGASIECDWCGNTFQHQIAGLELPKSCGVGKGMCAECFIEGTDSPEWREASEDIETRYKILIEGEAERVFPVEFAPGLGNLGHEDLTTGESMGFDQAWMLAKMPLVRDSIEYGEPNWTGFPTATAMFQHPDDPDIQYTMNAWDDQGGTRMNVVDPIEGKKATGNTYFQTGHDPHPNDTTTTDIRTKPDYRRLGIATAMYDLINEMSKTKGTRVSSTPRKLSHENAHLWRKALRRSRGFGFKNNSNEQIMWPEEGVYE